jgi:tetratricopeptide (TPR) repeat protein
VQKLSQMPQMMNGIANKLLAAAKKSFTAEEFATAERQASIVVTRFAGTAAAEEATGLLDSIAEAVRKAEAAAVRERLEQADEAARKAAEDREKVLEPLRADREKGRELNRRALKEKNQGKSKSLFDAAAASFERTIEKIQKQQIAPGTDPVLGENLAELLGGVKADAVGAFVNGGSIALARAAYTEAQGYARKAQNVDPESSVARSFHARVETAIAMKDDIDVRARRPRTGRR